jgi:TolA-binding protein
MKKAIAISLSGCSGNRAAELFETAQFEEVQNNQEHAKQLYSEIIAKYPESEYAKKAKERLSEL